MEEIKLEQSDFVAWKNDRTTQFIFKYLREVADYCLESMVSKDLIGNPNGLLRLNELRGYVDAIEDLLSMDPSSIVDETIEEGNNSDETNS